ncbi:MAG: FeoB-associated Cys-rich membrane protein [Spirochaetales bacterium]|nr:FeoB-associated Cys-rich membrane protein [Spirochaetales bacterium]MBR1583600.1 FeoB-associated Cys-rich membrane protein [Spirochaetales bacterium]
MGTAIVLLVLAALLSLIVLSMVRDRKAGKNSCGHKCGCCPMAGQCHKYKKN